MNDAERYAFTQADQRLDETSYRPMLSLKLSTQERSIDVEGLLDSGAMVNVLPYHLGLALGAFWDQQPVVVRLTGNLAQFEARALILSATVGRFAQVRQAFAWTRSTDVPRILGQVNFFQEFDVCFFRSKLEFEIKPTRVSSE